MANSTACLLMTIPPHVFFLEYLQKHNKSSFIELIKTADFSKRRLLPNSYVKTDDTF